MCECLEYDDGGLYLCPVCADLARETEKTLHAAMRMLEILQPNILNAGGSVEFTALVQQLIEEGHTNDAMLRSLGPSPAAAETTSTEPAEAGRTPGWQIIDPPF